MSIDTYANLKTEIIDWCHRDDLDARIDTFIDICESNIFAPGKDPRGMDVQPLQMLSADTESTITTSTSDRFATLPTGYQNARKLRIQISNGESYEIFYRTPAQMSILSATGMPRLFTITSQIEFDRISDQVYTGYLQGIINFTALSSSNTTNAVLTAHPTIYLHGTLAALYQFTEELDKWAMHYQAFCDAMRGANRKANVGRYGPAPRIRVEGRTP